MKLGVNLFTFVVVEEMKSFQKKPFSFDVKWVETNELKSLLKVSDSNHTIMFSKATFSLFNLVLVVGEFLNLTNSEM